MAVESHSIIGLAMKISITTSMKSSKTTTLMKLEDDDLDEELGEGDFD
jgi:hypothetical protein